ncbi:MAG: 3-dehydroquinate synthase II, partial [Aquificaceae bacterium]|nr:3-dehydroquinate synthase II [Aquificaceae bacterium]
MKEFWYWVEEFDKKLITTALESGAKVLLLSEPSRVQEVRALGRVLVASREDGDLKEGQDFVYVLIKGKEDEERAGRYPAHVKVVVETTDWTVIPLENLIAQREELYAVV